MAHGTATTAAAATIDYDDDDNDDDVLIYGIVCRPFLDS